MLPLLIYNGIMIDTMCQTGISTLKYICVNLQETEKRYGGEIPELDPIENMLISDPDVKKMFKNFEYDKKQCKNHAITVLLHFFILNCNF